MKYEPHELEFIKEYKSVLESLRIDGKYTKEINSLVKYRDDGKIDVARINWEQGKNKRMNV